MLQTDSLLTLKIKHDPLPASCAVMLACTPAAPQCQHAAPHPRVAANPLIRLPRPHPLTGRITAHPQGECHQQEGKLISGVQALKAACDDAIAVLVSRTGQASAMWERLLAAVVVAPSMSDDPSTGRYDISYQLAEIEVLLFMASHACICICTGCT